ncbi:hypothetical protein T07_386 [Trichinella nelsoni]|uniref:Uncharacterized protein n=1 Tax=Trichinella nelsoni TaxID=6336 RepID=A0A0V0S373_9BILA|nr:hypothetical protein T07_386 [Trichinella nelsoni]
MIDGKFLMNMQQFKWNKQRLANTVKYDQQAKKTTILELKEEKKSRLTEMEGRWPTVSRGWSSFAFGQ